uniref:GPbeta5-2 n=1 Tax=Galleria mellonella TaxID=7137 RepID=A0AA49XA66_GALME|nr:GPbeta5-2 [Galleria mellonella]
MVSNRSELSIRKVLLVFWCSIVLMAESSFSARCKLRKYTHEAIQTDLNGRRCWDDVKILGCWGYCLSHEVSIFKRNYHHTSQSLCV